MSVYRWSGPRSVSSQLEQLLVIKFVAFRDNTRIGMEYVNNVRSVRSTQGGLSVFRVLTGRLV